MAYKNKEDQKQACKKHYEENKTLYKKRAKDSKILAVERNKEFVDDYLEKHPCTDCGESDIIVLDFDHVTGEKTKNLSDGVRSGWSLEKNQKGNSKM